MDDTKQERLTYRLLTGDSSREFCERVSEALADGYALYGSPAIAVLPDGTIATAQAVILEGRYR
jgi:hypothetical protein